jgi:hypothetical protein
MLRLGRPVSPGKPDRASIVAGIAVLALGAVLLLDETGVIELSFAVLAPVACAAMGAILLARGLTRGR